jgi:hypothetical protein
MGREVQVGVRREVENDSGNGSKWERSCEGKKEDRGGRKTECIIISV